jgi:hypothetical protein
MMQISNTFAAHITHISCTYQNTYAAHITKMLHISHMCFTYHTQKCCKYQAKHILHVVTYRYLIHASHIINMCFIYHIHAEHITHMLHLSHTYTAHVTYICCTNHTYAAQKSQLSAETQAKRITNLLYMHTVLSILHYANIPTFITYHTLATHEKITALHIFLISPHISRLVVI